MPDKAFALRAGRHLGPTLLTAVILVGFAFILPSATDLALGVNIGVAAIAAVGLTLTIGGAGQFSLGQAGFMAIGGYGTAYLMLDREMAFLPALSLAVPLALVVGVLVGYVALRLHGHYLAMATLAVGTAIYGFLMRPGPLGGVNGYAPIPFPEIFGYRFTTPRPVPPRRGDADPGAARLRWLLSARMGRELAALRDDEVAAASVGVNITARKVQIFAISAGIGALAGGVNAPLQTAIDPSLFSAGDLHPAVRDGDPRRARQHLRRGRRRGAGDLADLGGAGPGSWALTVLGIIVIASWPRCRTASGNPAIGRNLLARCAARTARARSRGCRMRTPGTAEARGSPALRRADRRLGRELHRRQGRDPRDHRPERRGKTTLLNLLSGLHRPIPAPSHRRRRRDALAQPQAGDQARLVRTFQTVRLFSSMSSENLMVAARTVACPPRPGPASTRPRRLSLTRWPPSAATALSYGLQRRVELARVMVADPAVVLLDEPAAGLSPQERRDLAGR